jgi:tripartite-type tricarboxylate transporter receptor subunit TctC
MLKLVLATLAAAAVTSGALAQTFPSKPIRLLIPFSAGGAQDTVARGFSGELGAALGQSVVVENRPGAGGTTATAQLAKLPADGYTLMLSAVSHTINGTLYTKLPYDPIRDFTAVSPVGNSSYVLVIKGSLPVNTVAEFVAFGKANSGRLNYASGGIGSAGHLSVAYFLQLAGFKAEHIPTKGMGEAMTEVLAERSDLLIATNNIALPYKDDKRVKLLGVTSAKPNRFVTGVPAIEPTVRGYTFESWFGLIGPAGIPREIVERLHRETQKVIKSPEVAERLLKQGLDPLDLSPEQFAAYLKADFERMAQVVRASGAKID